MSKLSRYMCVFTGETLTHGFNDIEFYIIICKKNLLTPPCALAHSPTPDILF